MKSNTPVDESPARLPSSIKQLLVRELKRYLSLIEDDKLECSTSEAMHVIGTLTHEPMSKESVLIYLGWSRSKFDDYCARGLMPKGRKRQGWKELCWYKDQINDALIVLRQKGF